MSRPLESSFVISEDFRKPNTSSSTQQEPEKIPPICATWRETARIHFQLTKAHPQTPCLAVFIFIVMLASGLAIVSVFSNAEDNQLQEDALSLAEETGLFFSKNLDQAILPLFSLAQFVNELEMFQGLPQLIGLPGQNNSLPFLPPKAPDQQVTHRNVTGVCDDPALVQRYSKIAGTIKKDAGMDGILVNLQLVPDAVVCLVHPLNNTEDFPEGIFMDNTGVIGHDLLTDPTRKFIAEVTVPSTQVVIAGPLTLRQCQDCDPTVEKAFIARLPIASDTNIITVNGEEHLRWGFAVGLINWNELVSRSGVYETFEEGGLEFQLTRTDQKYNIEQDTYAESVVILAESSDFDLKSPHKVTTALPTTNNEWEITVTYCNTKQCVIWYPWAIGAVVIISVCISVLVYTIFSQKQLHSDVLAETSRQMVDNAHQAAKVERELNDFIAHEVRNPIAAALSACSFVSASVNETQPLVDIESRECVRDDVRIIESSLQFVNDLLRSMLDLHRARNKQMTLDYLPTDIKHDILDSVASMLYRRDENFEVIVDCPENMIASVDPLRLKQIILNLARNSAKFVKAGFVRLRAETTDHGICIYVEDSGPGIPEEKRGSLFAKFQQSLDQLSQGTGIGLSLCQKLIDLMNGSIELDMDYHSGLEGKPGAKFNVDLKCDLMTVDMVSLLDESIEEGETVHESDGSGESSWGSIREGGATEGELTQLPKQLSVLFVDDDMVLRKLFTRALKRVCPNWTIEEAADGETSLVMTETKEYDMIFLDQYMTSVEKQLLGTETARILRSKGVKSIICGLSANDMEIPFKTAGADEFVIKPFPCKQEPMKRELLRILTKKD